MTGHATSGSLLAASTAHSSMSTPIRVAAVGLGVALTAASAQFTMRLAFTDVPVTLQPAVVLLTGAVLGARLGAVTQALYLMAGVLGLQVFALDPTLPQGAARLVGPTGGYLLSYPLAAYLTGWLAERGWDRRSVTSFAALVLGLAVIYTGGVAWRMTWLGAFDVALATSVWPFLAPDLLKLVAIALVLPQAWRFVGRR
jgi:biotin transport system substrate-specific component